MDLEELARRLDAARAGVDGLRPGAVITPGGERTNGTEEIREAGLDPAGPRAAVALVLRSRSDPEVLLMRRAERAGDRWSGHIALPGGHADREDRDLVATALRETREEVGLDLARDGRLLGHLPPLQAKARGQLLSLWIMPFVFSASDAVAPVPGPEAVEVFWFPLERARAGELAWTHRYVRDGQERALPAWRFGERVVWGLTYEILSGLLRVAP